jgi:molybdopterin-guanine dinucleotide biosynthesis protein
MAPVLVGICGDRSGSGKTLLATRLLGRLKGWGGIKCSPSSLYTSVIDDSDTLREPGKDTARYLDAGASEAVWVRAPRDEFEEPLSIARGKLSHLEGIVIEGNSAVETLKETTDVIIFIVSGSEEGIKNNTETLLGRADVVLYRGGETPARKHERARTFSMEEEDAFMDYVLELIDGRRKG